MSSIRVNTECARQKQDDEKHLAAVVAATSFSNQPQIVLHHVGECLKYREVVRLSRCSKVFHTALRRVAVWESVELQKVVRQPANTVVGSFRRVVISEVAQLLRLDPKSVSLTFDEDFNQSIANAQLPCSLKHLDFGGSFDQEVDDLRLPESLTVLRFGYDFNQPVEQLRLPSTLTHLGFSVQFNQSVEGLQLPSCLRTLEFHRMFKQPVNKLQMPSSLRLLQFLHPLSQPIMLPNQLTHLRLGGGFSKPIECLELPNTLRFLVLDWINQPISQLRLPLGLTHLKLTSKIRHPIQQLQLPELLLHLEIENQPLDSLPNTLIQLAMQFDSRLQLPAGLTHLVIFGDCDHPIENLGLPSSLTHLRLCDDFNQPLDPHALPPNLIYLEVEEGSYRQTMTEPVPFLMAHNSGKCMEVFEPYWDSSLECM
jgi:hypothetical protein